MAVEAKLEVEIWRRPQKINFWPWFPIHSFRQFLAKTYRFAAIKMSQTDRQTTQCAKGATDSTVGQKLLADTNGPRDALRHTQSPSCCAQSCTLWSTGDGRRSTVDNTWRRSTCRLEIIPSPEVGNYAYFGDKYPPASGALSLDQKFGSNGGTK